MSELDLSDLNIPPPPAPSELDLSDLTIPPAPESKDDTPTEPKLLKFTPKPGGRKRSIVWQHFKFAKGDTKATTCDHCSKKVPYSGNTSSMNQHLEHYHYSIVHKPTGANSLPKSTQMSLKDSLIKGQLLDPGCPRAQEISRKVAEFIVIDGKPISDIEGQGLRNLVKKLEPRYQMPSSDTIYDKYILPMYHDTRHEVKQELSKALRHAFTTDGWQSISTKSFITYTAHYISENFELVEKVLETIESKESHSAENLAKGIREIINDWGLKDPAGVSDNARNVVKAMELLEGDTLNTSLGCFAHTMNIAVNRCLKVTEVSQLVGKCRKIVAVFKQSALKTTSLMNAQQLLELGELKVIQDVETRWNSAYYMVMRILKIFPAIVAVLYQENLKHLVLTDSELDACNKLVQLLGPFEIATKMVSSSKKPTISLILPLMNAFKGVYTAENPDDSTLIKKAKTAIRSDLEKRYQSPNQQKLLSISTFVDPRFKLNAFKDSESDSVKELVIAEALKSCTDSKLESLVKVEPKDNTNNPNPPQITEQPTPDLSDIIFLGKKSSVALSPVEKVRREIDHYLAEDHADQGVHPLDWWRERRGEVHYRTLPNLVMKVLCIPATSVASERVFSSAGHIMSKKRASMGSDTLGVLLFLYKHYRS